MDWDEVLARVEYAQRAAANAQRALAALSAELRAAMEVEALVPEEHQVSPFPLDPIFVGESWEEPFEEPPPDPADER